MGDTSCPGSVRSGIGCEPYIDSDDYERDSHHEDYMRGVGLGFGDHLSIGDATMSMHLQICHAISADQAEKILSQPMKEEQNG